jgi:hypothetical protein
MAANDETGESSHDALQRALDEAASNMANLRKAPNASTALPTRKHQLKNNPELKPHEPDNDENETILLTAQFDLFKFLVHKAGAAAEPLLFTESPPPTLQEDFQRLVKLANLVDRVERDGFQSTEQEERLLQATLDVLVAFYVGDPEVDERIRGVVAVEEAVGYSGGG